MLIGGLVLLRLCVSVVGRWLMVSLLGCVGGLGCCFVSSLGFLGWNEWVSVGVVVRIISLVIENGVVGSSLVERL